VVKVKTVIKTYPELEGKKVAVGIQGSSVRWPFMRRAGIIRRDYEYITSVSGFWSGHGPAERRSGGRGFG
jgi:TRAP-type uncharacterized transport system substrate-binding protein